MKTFPKVLILPLITTCIVVIAIVIFYYSVAISPRGEEARKPESQRKTTETQRHGVLAVGDPRAADSTSFKDFIYPADSMRDPFKQVSAPIDIQQPPGPAVKQHSIMLTGVIWDEVNPVAIITDPENNSYLVRTGEEISRAKILAIRPGSITIERDGKAQEVVLWPAKL